jgi:hypothetical protein
MIKIVLKMISATVVLVCFLALMGCVDEPTIAPVERPYSMIRVGNLTSNLDAITVKIYTEIDDYDIKVDDVKTLTSITKNSFSDYFEVYSGKRELEALDQSGNIIFEKTIEATSFEVSSWFCMGYYHQNIDSTSFNVLPMYDATTYLGSVGKLADSSLFLAIVHASGDTPKEASLKFKVISVPDSSADITTYSAEMKYSETINTSAKSGNHTFYVINSVSADTILAYPTTLTQDTHTYLYLVGTPGNPSIIKEEKPLITARPK